MIKDYIIIDDVFENPDEVINFSRNISYYSKEKENLEGITIKDMRQGPGFSGSKWRGFRSDFLHEIDQSFFQKYTNQIFQKIFSDFDNTGLSFNYEIATHMHFAPSRITYSDSWWHTDPGCLFAGVVYLTKNPESDSGTILKLDDREVVLENVFNRLVVYRSNILHRPQKCFGTNVENSRLTFTLFVLKLMLIAHKNEFNA